MLWDIPLATRVKRKQQQGGGGGVGRPCLLPVAVLLRCTSSSTSTAQLFSVFSLRTHPYRPFQERKAGGPGWALLAYQQQKQQQFSVSSKAAAAKAEILVDSSAQLSAGQPADCQDTSTCTLIDSDQWWSANHLAWSDCHPSESSKYGMSCWLEVPCEDLFQKKLLCPVVANVWTKSANKTWSAKRQNRMQMTKHFVC